MRMLLFTAFMLAMGTDAAAQGSRAWPAFTHEEFFQVLRRIMPEVERQARAIREMERSRLSA